jgi:hypothetical protein
MSWYPLPFEKGATYRIKKDISELGHTFVIGEEVEFIEDSYDPKLGVIRFWFKNTVTGDSKAWHAWEDQMQVLDAWKESFAK